MIFKNLWNQLEGSKTWIFLGLIAIAMLTGNEEATEGFSAWVSDNISLEWLGLGAAASANWALHKK